MIKKKNPENLFFLFIYNFLLFTVYYVLLPVVYCLVYIVYCVRYTVYCILNYVYFILYTVYCILYNIKPTVLCPHTHTSYFPICLNIFKGISAQLFQRVNEMWTCYNWKWFSNHHLDSEGLES